MGVSLKVVIGSMAALIIGLTTLLALVITQTFTMNAMRDIGRDHAAAIVAAANSQVSSYFDQSVIQSRNMQVLVGLNTWMIPQDAAAAGKVWYADFLTQMLTLHFLFNFSYFTNILFWASDGSWIMLYPPAVNATTFYAYVSGPGRAKAMGFLRLYTANGTVKSSNLPTTGSGTDTLVSTNWIQMLPLGSMQQAWSEVGFGFGSVLETGYATLNSALVNASGTRIGLLGVNFALDRLHSLLKTVNLTKNSVAFMFDSLNMVVATTQNQTITRWLGTFNASLHYPAGCYNTTAVGTGVVCRLTAALYPFGPLQALFARSPQLLDTSSTTVTDGAELIKLNGKNYYVSVSTVVCAAPPKMKIALFMPESDIIGEVIKGRNIAIGVMCAVCVVFVVIAFIFVTLVLSPLEVISDRMYDAAELNDTSNDESLSALSEIAALQDSYHNLRTKLNEMKAFVPQTVLHGEDEEEGSVESDKDKPADTQSRQSRRSRHSSHEAGAMSNDTASTRGGLASRGLNVASSLIKKGVAVLCINVRGFHAAIDPLSAADALGLCSKMAAVVVKEVRSQKGVIGQFHGDHFLATFNAASAAASPAKRAAIAALKISEALKSLQLQSTFGIAFGVATCGNTGCAELKGYSVIGPVVAQAIAMERLAKLCSARTGGEINALATDKCSVDMECEVLFQAVDFVAIPQPMLVVAVMGLKSSKEDEWMYRLQETESKDPFVHVNNGFRALLDGDADGARAALLKRTAANTADAYGAAQLQKKLSQSGKECVEDADPETPPVKLDNRATMPTTSYGTYFRALF